MGMRKISILTTMLSSAVCAVALSGTATRAATVKLVQHAALVPGSGITGTWLTSYDGGVRNAFTAWQKGGTASQIVDFAAKTGNVMLGGWKANGDGTMSLSLIGWTYDDKGNTLIGYFTKTETDTPAGNSYSGTFEVTFYDLQGNIQFQHDGTLTATRVN